MLSPSVVIAQSNPTIAQGLATDLHAHFAQVAVAHNPVELRSLLLHHQARVAVIDLELVNLEELQKLAVHFSDLAIVCTHRSPDERMWMAALNAGAVEFCHPQDIHSILRASRTATAAPHGLEFAA
jgi:DNA-binding NarL/FixJ family response regulator